MDRVEYENHITWEVLKFHIFKTIYEMAEIQEKNEDKELIHKKIDIPDTEASLEIFAQESFKLKLILEKIYMTAEDDPMAQDMLSLAKQGLLIRIHPLEHAPSPS